MLRATHTPKTLTRRGTLLPVVVLSLLVVLGVMAIVLNQLWVNTAWAELQGSVDAAALAAANGLVDDDLIRPKAKVAGRVEAARMTAVAVASKNLIAGQPLALDASVDGDLKFGDVVINGNGQRVFLSSDNSPTAVSVKGHRTQDRSNPLGLLLAETSGRSTVNLTAEAEATIENRVIALRPATAFNVPAFPLAILHSDPTGRQKITWQTQILERLGADQYGFDPKTKTVVKKPDGIPEIELVGENENAPPNACLIDVGNRFNSKELGRQIHHGWAVADLSKREGELPLQGKHSVLPASPAFGTSICQAFREMRGQPRIVVLYASIAADVSSATSIQCAGFAAGRVMNVVTSPNEAPRIVFQPAVIATRAVVLDTEQTNTPAATANAYIYKVRLTK